MYITQETHKAVQELISLTYKDNARIDRMKSVLLAQFSYNETAEIVHEWIAHYFSNGIGDALSEICLERYNIPVVFGGIPVMDKEYTSVKEVLDELLELAKEYQFALSRVIDIAVENEDRNVSADLIDFMRDYSLIVDQCILLVDKIDMYNNNPSYDAHIKDHFFILQDLRLWNPDNGEDDDDN